MVKISAVIPVYNVEKYLEECLSSLVNQTYPLHEIIAVNDGSTDKSAAILNTWAEKNPLIKVVHQDHSGAPGGPRNVGLSITTGDYISFIDSDDYVGLDYYEKMVANIIEYGPEMIITNIVKFNSKKEWIPPTFQKVDLFKENRLTNLYNCFQLIHNLGPANKLFKKDFLIDNKLRFIEGCAFEDVHFTSCCLYSAKKVYVNKDVTYYWRRREEAENLSITQQKHLFKSVEDRINIHERIDQFLKERGLLNLKYIKDIRAILDFVRHGAYLYNFTQDKQERFFERVISYLGGIDEKAFNFLPEKEYNLARYFFLINKLSFELIALSTNKFGFLPAYTERKDTELKVYFDFKYLKGKYQRNELLADKVEVPEPLRSSKAILLKGTINSNQLLLEGYGFINYIPVYLKSQIEIDLIMKNRTTKESIRIPARIYESLELKTVIPYHFCKFKVEIEAKRIRELIRPKNKIDFSLSITIDGINKVSRLSWVDHTSQIVNLSSEYKLYITKKGNISVDNKGKKVRVAMS